jgi:microcystin degradation protein MlrC
MAQETNTFSPLRTTLEDFGRDQSEPGPSYGPDALRVLRASGASPAYIEFAERGGHAMSTPVAAWAVPGGIVENAAFETMAGRILQAVCEGCDAALLDLHGGMVVEGVDDPEGELLRRIRALHPSLPITVALDFHSNLSPVFYENSTIVTGYRTYPHTDVVDTGRRAVRTLARMMAAEVDPVLLWRRLPILSHMNRQTPLEQPMKDIMDRAIAAEDADEVLNASVFGGFPLADVPWVGLAVVIVADRRRIEAGRRLLDELSAMAWQRRADFVYHIEPMAESIARAAAIARGPVVLADHGDNAGSGGPADDMTVLAECLRHGLSGLAAGPVWDPAAVAQMIATGPGGRITLTLGGKTDSPAIGRAGRPLELSGTVRSITDGRFRMVRADRRGVTAQLGRTAVLDIGSALIVVSERRFEPSDIGVFTHCGIDPSLMRYVLVKSRQHFKAAFGAMASEIIMVAGPGVATSDYAALPFRNIPRPIFPLDPDMVHDPLMGMDQPARDEAG